MQQRVVLLWVARLTLLAITVAVFTSTLSEAWVDSKNLMLQHSDKVGHFISMFFFTALALIGLPRAPASWLFTISIGLAALVEVVQIFNSRNADLVDFGASTAGTIAVAIIYFTPIFREQVSSKPS